MRGLAHGADPAEPGVGAEPGAQARPPAARGARARGLTDGRRRASARAARGARARLRRVSGRYAHQLSGGMQQRVVNAMALRRQPEVVIADEPTSGLDAELVDTTAAQLLDDPARGSALIVITHDLRLAERLGGRLALLYASRIVEVGRPRRSSPARRTPTAASCCARCPSARASRSPACRRSSRRCRRTAPSPTAARTASTAAPRPCPTSTPRPATCSPGASPMLSAESITTFLRRACARSKAPRSARAGRAARARRPERSGKSTLAQALALLQPPDGGAVTVDGAPRRRVGRARAARAAPPRAARLPGAAARGRPAAARRRRRSSSRCAPAADALVA